MKIAPVFILDRPHYHRIHFGETHEFHGVALAIDDPEIDSVIVRRDGRAVAEAAVNIDSPELAQLVHVPRAAKCRFSVEVRVAEGDPLDFSVRRSTGSEETLFRFDLPWLAAHRDEVSRVAGAVETAAVPSASLIATTQGIASVDAYRDSIVSGLYTAKGLLRASGVDDSGLRRILDIGCGTGRLLLGWHCDDPQRALFGADINRDLIGWNGASLPGVASWIASTFQPPLDLPAGSFDLILLASVFTHLRLESQRHWLGEIRRLLKPGGTAMISLHGDIYGHLLLDPSTFQRFLESGYVESAGGPEGNNSFSTFHSPAFALREFSDFGDVKRFERGVVIDGMASHFPIASMQDVYVLRR